MLHQQLDKALHGYRMLRTQDPSDKNLNRWRLLRLSQRLFARGKTNEALAMLHLTAEFNPEFIKKMSATLNNEIRLILKNPMLPETMKKKIKAGYNKMMHKLGLAGI